MMMLSNPHPLLDRRQLFGEHPHALKSHRILSDEAGVDHRYMFGLAPVVITEAGDLAFAMKDDPFTPRLRGKERYARP